MRIATRPFVAPVETPIRPNFGKQPKGIRPRRSLGVSRMQFDDLNVVAEDQKPLFMGSRIQKLANVPPILDE